MAASPPGVLSPVAPQAASPAPSADRTALAAPWLLGGALALAALYAAFAQGAVDTLDAARLEVGLAAIAIAALTVLLRGRGLRLDAPRRAYAGLACLAALAAWSGLSMGWSIAPDLTWLDLNRTMAFTLAAALAVAVGASLPRAIERTALAYLVVATAVALYALGGKVLPWLEVPGVLDLDHTAELSRLRAPLGYWNALAAVCVLSVPIALRAAAQDRHASRTRAAALLATVPLLVALGLTYSRGGLIALAVGVGVLVALGPDRGRLLALTGAAAAGAVPAVVVTVSRSDLTTDGAGLSARADDGLLVLAALALGVINLWVLRRLAGVARARRAARPGAAAVRRGPSRRRPAAALVTAIVLLLVASFALTAGPIDVVRDAADDFTETKLDRQNDPSRVLQTNSGNRWVWWGEAVGGWWERPLSGQGAGSFPLVHRRYRDNDLDVKQAHSVPLQLLAETGLVGALLALGGLGLLVSAGVSRLRASAGAERAYAAALAAGVAAWMVHALLEWHWNIPGVTLPVLVFLGVLAARGVEEPGVERPVGWRAARSGRPRLRGLALGLGAALLVAVAASSLLPALARERAREALAAAAAGGEEDLQEGAALARTAADLDPLSVAPVFAAASIAEGQGRRREVGRLLVEAVERQPQNPATWLRLLRHQILLRDLDASRQSAEQVLRLDPRGGAGRLVGAVLPRLSAIDTRSATATATPLPPPPPPVPVAPPVVPPPAPGSAPPLTTPPTAQPPPAIPPPG